ncbi:MAG: JAB domain-containing protein [Dehalococcoidia bacterium]
MRYCGSTIQIKVLDHIIIGENRYFSFADAGLIEEYNLAFLSLKEGKRS